MRTSRVKPFLWKLMIAVPVTAFLLWIREEGIALLVNSGFLVMAYRETRDNTLLFAAVAGGLVGAIMLLTSLGILA